MDSLDSVTKPEATQGKGGSCGSGAPRPSRARAVVALVEALAISFLAAAAVELGFGAAFVSSGVAWATTTYSVALVAMIAGRDGSNAGVAHRAWLRIPLAIAIGSSSLWLLRGPLMFELPGNSFTTTGHTPFVVFPVAALLCNVTLLSIERLNRN